MLTQRRDELLHVQRPTLIRIERFEELRPSKVRDRPGRRLLELLDHGNQLPRLLAHLSLLLPPVLRFFLFQLDHPRRELARINSAVSAHVDRLEDTSDLCIGTLLNRDSTVPQRSDELRAVQGTTTVRIELLE